MTADPHMDVSTDQPPNELSAPLQALWWLKKGGLKVGPEWHEAHEICQSAEGEPAHDWVHALCHLIEGDHGNAGYWFRRAGQPVESDVESLWQKIVSSL